MQSIVDTIMQREYFGPEVSSSKSSALKGRGFQPRRKDPTKTNRDFSPPVAAPRTFVTDRIVLELLE